MRDGEWFEGCYVFETSAARETFEQRFKEAGAGSPSSQIIGSAPTLIEACEIVAVAEGAIGVRGVGGLIALMTGGLD